MACILFEKHNIMKHSPKIVIIGAGSLYFGRQAIWAVAHLPGFQHCELCLVDTDDHNLERLEKLARLAITSEGVKLECTQDYRAVLDNADFVVLSFSEKNAYYRRIECEVGAKYGVRSCSGDTIGPAGIFHTLREFDKILEIAHAMEKQCPDALLINYVNPAATMGIGLMRHAKIRSIALCDTHHMPAKKLGYLKLIGEDESRMDQFDMRIAGVNHFTWMLKAELDGKDVLPEIRDAFLANGASEIDAGYAKSRFNNTITAQLCDLFGALPTCTGHTKEYLPFYQGKGAIQEKVPPLSVFNCDERDERTSNMWKEIDGYISGRRPMTEFHASMRSDHATDLIHSMVVGDDRTYYVNRSNSDCVEDGGRAVENLPDDAFLELHCKIVDGVLRPFKVGSFPYGLRGQQFHILDIHELTIEGIMQRDRELLVRALSMDPIVNSIATARVLIQEIAQAEAEAMPDWMLAPKEPNATPKARARTSNGDDVKNY